MTIDLMLDELKALKPDSAVVGFDSTSVWQTDDREWFDARPTRGYRMRKVYAGEPGLTHVAWTVIKKVQEDGRSKLPIAWVGQSEPVDMLAQLARLSDVPSRDAYYDIVLGLMYEGIVKRRFQPLGVLLAQAEALHGWAPATRQ